MDADALLNPERRMLRVMQGKSGHDWTLAEILSACEWVDQAVAAGAGHGLSNSGFVSTTETSSAIVRLAEEGQKAKDNGLLEARIWKWISDSDTPSMADLQSQFERHEAGPGVGLLKRLGVQLEGGVFVAADPSTVDTGIEARTAFIHSLPAPSEALDGDLMEHFKTRRGLIESVISTTRTWSITPQGQSVKSEALVEKQSISEITTELLQSDAWKDADYRPFDVTLESATPRTGRSHPMQALIERVRSIFLEMGFSELVDDYVQTAGWNMDALFIPQDHPAREMQDTFYLEDPKSIELPKHLTDAWGAIHEHGGETGSVGWGGKFSAETSEERIAENAYHGQYDSISCSKPERCLSSIFS